MGPEDDILSYLPMAWVGEVLVTSLAQAITASIRAVCNLRGEVAFKPLGSLPNDGKVIDDTRKYD